MKKILLVFVVLAGFVFGGTVFAGPSTEAPAGEMAASTGEPQYGGTLTLFIRHDYDPPGPDIKDAFRDSFHWLDFLQQKPIVGDYETYGPMGSGVYEFGLLGAIPDKYQKGLLLESWETTFEKLTWHVRPGIYWAPTATQSAWMKAREFTAADLVNDIVEFANSPYKRRFDGLLKPEGVKQIDKYTLEIWFDQRFSADVFYFIGYEDRSVVAPPELQAAPGRAGKWENQVGTGPWQFDEYVVGAYFAMQRNKDYWDTTVIGGKEYQLPFIDRVVLPIIPDETTRLAAMKTGKADLDEHINSPNWDTMDKVQGIMAKNIIGGANDRVVLRANQPPFNDVRVRNALFMATDLTKAQSIRGAEGLPIHFFPIYPGAPSYTALEKLPADIKQLYEYNPEKAKKLLAEAGYPNGFEMNFNTDSEVLQAMDLAALCADQWGKIGVKVTIIPRDSVEHTRMKYSHADPPLWTGALYDHLLEASETRMYTYYHKTGVDLNYADWSNKRLDELCELMEAELDPDIQQKYIKEAGDILMREGPYIPATIIPTRIFWWPWVKNYWGAYTIQDDCNFSETTAYMWIDQDLKKQMGY
ncbi:MAG: ABC transporter substrate-binding protein [Spirochaetales bacterium]|nr:ABC transporter substrate-binding protein [Spirochaetales bacterium]